MEKLISLLNRSKFDYELIKHENTIHSAQEGANYFGIEIGQTAPILILSTDKGFIALIVSGNKGRINFNELGEKLGLNIKGLAKKSEVEEVTGFSIGTVPLVGYNLPTIIDSDLFQYTYVYGGIGNNNCTLKINPKALKELNDVIAQI